jgi:hypothetical protein
LIFFWIQTSRFWIFRNINGEKTEIYDLSKEKIGQKEFSVAAGCCIAEIEEANARDQSMNYLGR